MLITRKRTKYLVTICVFIFVITSTTFLSSVLAETYMNDGRARYEIDIEEPIEMWRVKTTHMSYSHQDIDIDDEMIYFCSENGDVIAVDFEGRLQWSYEINEDWHVTIVSTERHVYLGNEEKIIALDKAGEVSWEFAFPESDPAFKTIAHITIGLDAVYVVVNDTLYALNVDGELTWYVDDISSRVYIGLDHRLYTSSNDMLRSYNSDGSLNWEVDIPGQENGYESFLRYSRFEDLSLTEDFLYLIDGKSLYVYDYQGVLEWTFDLGYYDAPSVSVDKDGTVYAVAQIGIHSHYRSLVRLSNEGEIEWQKSLNDWEADSGNYDLVFSPLITENSIIQTFHDYLIAFNKNGDTLWEFQIYHNPYVIGQITSRPIPGPNNQLYLKSISRIIAIGNTPYEDSSSTWYYIPLIAALIAVPVIYYTFMRKNNDKEGTE